MNDDTPINEEYSNTANELVRRIQALIPEHPEILELDSPWDLFKIKGFTCNDLNPSLFQAQWALEKAIALNNEKCPK